MRHGVAGPQWAPRGRPRPVGPVRRHRGGSPRRPSVRHNAPHAAFRAPHAAATHRTPCAPFGSFSSISIASGPLSGASAIAARLALAHPARLEEQNGSGPSIITNDLEKKTTDALAATRRTPCAPRVLGSGPVWRSAQRVGGRRTGTRHSNTGHTVDGLEN